MAIRNTMQRLSSRCYTVSALSMVKLSMPAVQLLTS